MSGFVRNRVDPRLRRVLQDHLDAWFALVARASWRSSAELKQQFSSASIVSAERVVFNIQGNKYRLLVAVDYNHGMILVLWLGTHAEYDQIDVRQVEFEKERYANPASSN